MPIRIEAAAARGKPVYFEIAAPWTRPRNEGTVPGSTSGERIGLLIRTFLVPSVLVVAALLAFRNVRLGRGDRRGATRLSLCLFAAGAVSNALATGDLQVLSSGPALIFVVPALVWLLYVALEPQLRRVWPETMIGWSRLLAGSVRDPLVGRDVLIGVLIAIGDGLMLGASHAGATLVGPAAIVSGGRLEQSVGRHRRLERPAPRRALCALADHRLGVEHPALGRRRC